MRSWCLCFCLWPCGCCHCKSSWWSWWMSDDLHRVIHSQMFLNRGWTQPDSATMSYGVLVTTIILTVCAHKLTSCLISFFKALPFGFGGPWSLNLLPPQTLVTSSSLFYSYITRNNSLSPVHGLNLASPVKVKEVGRKRALNVTKNDELLHLHDRFLAPPAEKCHHSKFLIRIHRPPRRPSLSCRVTIWLEFLFDPFIGHNKLSFITNERILSELFNFPCKFFAKPACPRWKINVLCFLQYNTIQHIY